MRNKLAQYLLLFSHFCSTDLVSVLCFSIWYCHVPTKLHEKTIFNTTLSSMITFNEFLSFSNGVFIRHSGQKWSHAPTHITSLLLSYCGFGRMLKMKQYHKVYLSLLGICVQWTIKKFILRSIKFLRLENAIKSEFRKWRKKTIILCLMFYVSVGNMWRRTSHHESTLYF